MARYILKSSGGYVGTDNEEDISDWLTDEDYKKYTGEIKEGRRELLEELEQVAIEQQGFEWYVKMVDDDYEEGDDD